MNIQLLAALVAEKEIHTAVPMHGGEAPPQAVLTGIGVPDVPARRAPHRPKVGQLLTTWQRSQLRDHHRRALPRDGLRARVAGKDNDSYGRWYGQSS